MGTAAKDHFTATNPHALATILAASETRSIIAATDIFDINGIKLWAQNQPVSAELQRRLMDRSLQAPLETSLIAEDGVTQESLQQHLKSLLKRDSALSPMLNPHAATLLTGAGTIRLHPVAQLLLSAIEATRPEVFSHAIDAMALAGALVAGRGQPMAQVNLAMTAGLLHDIGEMYISPEFGEADPEATMEVENYRQLVVHPHIGQLLLSQLTDYPKEIIRAVAEHHERMDGSGYPHSLTGDQLSPLGKLLAATEAALATLRQPGATLQHASVALRAVPGEFDVSLSGPLSAAARHAEPMTTQLSLEGLQDSLNHLDTDLETALLHAHSVLNDQTSADLQRAAQLTEHLLGKLRDGWNQSGLWSASSISQLEVPEAEAVRDVLLTRLRSIERMARLSAGTLSSDEQELLERLCGSLVPH